MTNDDIEHVYYLLSRTLVLNEENVWMIIDAVTAQQMGGTPEQISFASRIKAECLGLAFLFLGRWDKTGRLGKRVGMDLEEAKQRALAIAGAIDSAQWWIANRQTLQLAAVLEGKRQVEDVSSEEIADELKRFFRK
jgi:hypothetical protein